MKVIHVYEQYFAAEGEFGSIPRNGALVMLTATSDRGTILYEAAVTFFSHRDEEDYRVTYDAYFARELYSAKGRRSRKREQQLMERFREEINALAGESGGKVLWEKPLRDARVG